MAALTSVMPEASVAKRSAGYRLGSASWSIYEEAGSAGFHLFAQGLDFSAKTPEELTDSLLAEGQALRVRVSVRLLFTLIAFGVIVSAHPIAAGVAGFGVFGALVYSIRDFYIEEKLWEDRALKAERFLQATRVMSCLLKLGNSQKAGEA